MDYIEISKLQEFLDYQLPTDDDYFRTGITEKMVLDKKREVLVALYNFVNKNKKTMEETTQAPASQMPAMPMMPSMGMGMNNFPPMEDDTTIE